MKNIFLIGPASVRFLDRFERYKQYGDIQIFSNESPEMIVAQILRKLEDFK